MSRKTDGLQRLDEEEDKNRRKMLRICNRYKWETERRERWAFFEACQFYGTLKWTSAKAVRGIGQDLGWEVRVRVNHSIIQERASWTE